MSIGIDIDANYDDISEDRELGIARILRDIASKIEVGYDGGAVNDSDGNSIGTWALNE